MMNRFYSRRVRRGASLLVLLGAGLAFGASNTDRDDHKERNFNSGSSLAPFQAHCTKSPSYCKVVNKRVKQKWYESGYDGSRCTKSANLWAGNYIADDYFVGFKFYIPETTGNQSFPDDKNTILWQNMQQTSSSASTWMGVMELDNNNLDFRYRTSNGTSHTVIRMRTNLERGQWHEVKAWINPDQSGTNGDIVIYLNGTRRVSERDIRVGWGDTSLHRTVHWGIYAHDNPNYTNDETRTVYFDNVSLYWKADVSATRGLRIVDPG